MPNTADRTLLNSELNSDTRNTSRVLPKTYEEAMNMAGVTPEILQQIPLNPEYVQTAVPEEALRMRQHVLFKTAIYAIMAQGNDWLRQNREAFQKSLGIGT